MNRTLSSLLLALSLLTSGLVKAQVQQIVYSEPEREDGRRTSFEIIGKMNGNILIFKSNNSNNAVSIYDNDMKFVQRVPLPFIPEHTINVDFVAYSDHCWLIYEYQKKSIIHSAAVQLDAQAKVIGQPMELDTTQVGFSNSNKIYTVVVSEDKQKILIFKINSKNAHNFLFTTLVYNAKMETLDRRRVSLPMEDKNELFTDFYLDNEGQMIFGKYERSGSNDYVTRVQMVSKALSADSFSVKEVGTGERILDEVKIKVDNNNKRYILSGFYFKQRRGNIDGLYTVLWDKATNSKLAEKETLLSDDLRVSAKSSDATLKTAFNDYYIKNIITKRDGGYLMVCEAEYTTVRGNAFNRWDYYGSPYGYPYSPGYYNPYSPYGRNYGPYGNANRYHAENIMVLSFDQESNIQWNSVIPKIQYDDDNQLEISHELVNTGGELHFLFNQYEKRNLMLNDQSISPEGHVTRYPTLKNLDRGYDFMPRHGKQVSSYESIIPCFYRNYLCFAKANF